MSAPGKNPDAVLIHEVAHELWAAQASEHPCQYVLQHGLVQAQIGNQLLQLAVLLCKPPQPNSLLEYSHSAARPGGRALITEDLQVHRGRVKFSISRKNTSAG